MEPPPDTPPPRRRRTFSQSSQKTPLSAEEKEFLNLPDSQLAIRLHEKLLIEGKTASRFRSWLGPSIKQILAISAFVAAIIPLYELNKAAIDFVLKRRELASILERVEELITVDAMEDARAEIKQAQNIDFANTRLLRLQSIIDLEVALRVKQDVRSLRALEIRYKDVLPKSAPAARLLGAAYINWDLAVATKYLDQAEAIDKNKTPSLTVQILGDRILILTRRFQASNQATFLNQADSDFKKGEDLIKSHPNVDFSRALIGLYLNYSFIGEDRLTIKQPSGQYTPTALSRLSFSSAIQTGNPLLRKR